MERKSLGKSATTAPDHVRGGRVAQCLLYALVSQASHVVLQTDNQWQLTE